MSTERNKQLVNTFFARFAVSDVEGALSMMADDATWWILGSLPICGEHSKSEMAALLHGLIGATTHGLEMRCKGITAEGDRVAFEGESYAPLKNGKLYNNRYHFAITVRGEKIASIREYLDIMHTADVLRELMPPAA